MALAAKQGIGIADAHYHVGRVGLSPTSWPHRGASAWTEDDRAAYAAYYSPKVPTLRALRDVQIIRTMMWTGTRRGRVALLQVGDVMNWVRNQPGNEVGWRDEQFDLFVARSKTDQYGRGRKVPITHGLYDATFDAFDGMVLCLTMYEVNAGRRDSLEAGLKAVKAGARPGSLLSRDWPLFPRFTSRTSNTPEPSSCMTADSIGAIFSRAAVPLRQQFLDAGLPVPRISSHGLRSSHATLLHEAGAPIGLINEMAGRVADSTAGQGYIRSRKHAEFVKPPAGLPPRETVLDTIPR